MLRIETGKFHGIGFLIARASRALGLVASCLTFCNCGKSNPLSYSVDFEGGSAENIRVDSDNVVHFSLEPDPMGGERLWFYFRITSTEPIRPWFVLERDAAGAHQTNWEVVRPVFSADGINWVRSNEVSYKWPRLSWLFERKPVLRFRSPIASKTLWVAYAYPYTTKELRAFLKPLESDARVRISTFGLSETGLPLPQISIETPATQPSPVRRDIWVLSREHPGETPASFVLEGIVRALLGSPSGQQILSKYRVKLVPMVNLSGVVDGRYYRNVKGIDLAKDWKTFASSEMRSLHEAMSEDLDANRVALVLNLHSANHPKSHFFLEIPGDWLPSPLQDLQRRLIQGSRGVHSQLQVDETVRTWDYPVIASNFLKTEHNVLCLYMESNYSIGADGTIVTPNTLRDLGAAFVGVLDRVLVDGK